MFDVVSFLMGASGAEGKVVLEDGSEYSFTDDGDGNITIAEA